MLQSSLRGLRIVSKIPLCYWFPFKISLNDEHLLASSLLELVLWQVMLPCASSLQAAPKAHCTQICQKASKQPHCWQRKIHFSYSTLCWMPQNVSHTSASLKYIFLLLTGVSLTSTAGHAPVLFKFLWPEYDKSWNRGSGSFCPQTRKLVWNQNTENV